MAQPRVEGSSLQNVHSFLTAHSSKIWVAVGLIFLVGTLLSVFLIPGLNSDAKLGLGLLGGTIGFISLCIGLTKDEAITQLINLDPRDSSLCTYNFLEENFPLAAEHAERALQSGLSKKQERAYGALMGGICGDAAGAPVEFFDYTKGPYIVRDQFDMTFRGFQGLPRPNDVFNLKPGQWTDDGSMALCLADSLLIPDAIDKTGTMNTVDLQHRFIKWWNHGYNNAFGNDNGRRDKRSVGLGGNISESFQDPLPPLEDNRRTFATTAGNRHTSGNGSLMRNAPVALLDLPQDQIAELARQQSLTTHQGEEAAECAAFHAVLIHALIYDTTERTPREIFDSVVQTYVSPVASVQGLIQSKSNVPSNLNPGKMENWDWESKTFAFNEERLQTKRDREYVGSYAMDALAKALHCIRHTNNYKDAVTMAIEFGGDADSVGAIVGMIAGAMYGYQDIPATWSAAVMQWDNGTINGRAFLLCQSQEERETFRASHV